MSPQLTPLHKQFISSITIKTNCFAANWAKTPLAPVNLERRAHSVQDVLMGILFCGGGDLYVHTVRNEWKGNTHDRLLKGDVKYRFLVDMAAL